jgi:hypothetical protein
MQVGEKTTRLEKGLRKAVKTSELKKGDRVKQGRSPLAGSIFQALLSRLYGAVFLLRPLFSCLFSRSLLSTGSIFALGAGKYVALS